MFESYAQPDDLSYVVKNAPGSWKKLKDLCLAPFLKDAKTKTLKVNARYDLSINELVKASKQDYVNPDITDQHFPTKKCPATKKEMGLLHLNKNDNAKVITMVMKQLKIRPGTVSAKRIRAFLIFQKVIGLGGRFLFLAGADFLSGFALGKVADVIQFGAANFAR